MYQSTKTYGHELGFSACFRQWRATSHCRFLHGYALSFHFVFEAKELDHRNWVVDFGGLGHLKTALGDMFDHKLLVARDDPNLQELNDLHESGIAELVVLERVGCEAFAQVACGIAQEVLLHLKFAPRVRVHSCEVREHGSNSAIYIAPIEG